jgi:hypothetical protein
MLECDVAGVRQPDHLLGGAQDLADGVAVIAALGGGQPLLAGVLGLSGAVGGEAAKRDDRRCFGSHGCALTTQPKFALLGS